jgi:DNA modification methylase
MIINGNSEVELKQFPDDYFDSCVTDPNYGLSFMGMHWDYDVPTVELWKEVLRVLKPGAHLLSFGGTRTYHRLVVRIEDAGFEIRDQLQWIYGSGFPKSLNVEENGAGVDWKGWGTGLKPANEPICLARKPLSEKTIAKNVLKHGTGAININDCRIETNGRPLREVSELRDDVEYNGNSLAGRKDGSLKSSKAVGETNLGRWPSNVILDEEAAELLDLQAPKTGAMAPVKSGQNGKSKGIYGDFAQHGDDGKSFTNDGLQGASRFFYCAKASRSERNMGLEKFELKKGGVKNESGHGYSESDPYKEILVANHHPTVKPVKLMQYLVRLITPTGGKCLDPHNGSGTTGIACKLEGVEYVGIDREAEYCEISKARIEAWVIEPEDKQLSMF